MSVSVADQKLNLFWICLLTLITYKKSNCCPLHVGCQYFKEDNKYSCSGITGNMSNFHTLNLEESRNVKNLEICNLQVNILNLHKVNERFPNVHNITIKNGSLHKLTGKFLANNKIKVLIFKNLLIDTFPKAVLLSTKLLEILDLTGNRLKALDEATAEAINNIPNVILGDNPWNCSLDLEWVLKLNRTVENEKLKCYQYPYPGKPLIPIAQFKNNVQNNCPKECECWMPDVVRDPSNLKLEPIIEVNCSDRNLKELPSILPAKTKILMLERNDIQNLEPLKTNIVYRGVQDLYLDNNFISSIKDLEGVHWFSHFRVLSLRNNRLTQLPTYALDNALQQNPNMPVAVRLYLGGNPWRCDCVFIPGFQEILRKYETQVKDIDDIRCSYVQGDENSLALILELSRSSVCRLPSEYSIRALDLLNGVLASLIVLILGKLAYDYYHFKKTGRLPWIVTKMP